MLRVSTNKTTQCIKAILCQRRERILTSSSLSSSTLDEGRGAEERPRPVWRRGDVRSKLEIEESSLLASRNRSLKDARADRLNRPAPTRSGDSLGNGLSLLLGVDGSSVTIGVTISLAAGSVERWALTGLKALRLALPDAVDCNGSGLGIKGRTSGVTIRSGLRFGCNSWVTSWPFVIVTDVRKRASGLTVSASEDSLAFGAVTVTVATGDLGRGGSFPRSFRLNDSRNFDGFITLSSSSLL